MSINLHDIIKKWNTEKLIGFLRNQELNLDDEDFSCLRSQKISGSNFLLLKRKVLIDCKLKVGPTVTLLNLITEINTGMYSIWIWYIVSLLYNLFNFFLYREIVK
jgi:hypothetical protein